MPPEHKQNEDQSDAGPPSNDLPVIEDAYASEESSPQVVPEDDPQLVDTAARALDDASDQSDGAEELATLSGNGPAAATAGTDDTSDVGTVEPEAPTETTDTYETLDWANERSAHRIVVELKRIEAEVRELLEMGRDSKRKRKLSGTRRWFDLEEDLIAWRYTDRFDESTLSRLQELVAKRHYLFRRLRFLAGTRPVWNT